MGRDDREVIVVEREGGTLKWLLFGAAVGAGLALLFAPKPGKELRRDLGRRIKGLREFADQTVDELKMEFGGEEPGLASDGTHDDEEPAEPARPAVSGKAAAREELERRLAAARARRRQSVPDDEEPVA